MTKPKTQKPHIIEINGERYDLNKIKNPIDRMIFLDYCDLFGNKQYEGLLDFINPFYRPKITMEGMKARAFWMKK